MGNLILENPTFWTLELVVVILPQLEEILQMTHGVQKQVGTRTIEFILKHFSTVISSCLEQLSHPNGNHAVDLQRETREERCKYIRDMLKNKINPHLTHQKHKFMID